ncbi:MAG: hypothetical protein R2712_12040 [Vicinamibacterales bacterium]
MKKALASGWLAAVTANTVLTTPELAEAARGFYAARETEMYEGLLGLARRYLKEGAAGEGLPFWEARSAEAASNAPEADREAVEAAWRRLREAPSLHVRRGPDVAVAPRPAVGGQTIVLEPRLVRGPDDAGVRFVHDVDVVAIVELAPHVEQVPALYEAVVARSGPTDLSAFVTALATALARGWLAFR